MYPLITDSAVNESTSNSMARVTASAYNRNINKRSARFVNLYGGILFLSREFWKPVAYSNSE